MGRMRISNHSGRTKNSRGHNDRKMSEKAKEKAEHIDFEKSEKNINWHCYQAENPGLSFAEAEAKFYEEQFKKYIEEFPLHDRHKKNQPTVEKMLSSYKTKPDEEIIQIGNKNEHATTKELKKIMAEYIQWHRATFPNCKILDFSLHRDEATPHLHIRKCWTYFDDEWGCLKVGQDKSLMQDGITLPKEGKISKNNNRKMTYSAMCREKLIGLSREHGLDIEDKPKEYSKKGLRIDIYKLTKDCEGLENKLQSLNDEYKKLIYATFEQGGKTEAQDIEKYNLEMAMTRIENKITEYKEAIKGLEDMESKKDDLSAQIDTAQAELDKVIADNEKRRKEALKKADRVSLEQREAEAIANKPKIMRSKAEQNRLDKVIAAGIDAKEARDEVFFKDEKLSKANAEISNLNKRVEGLKSELELAKGNNNRSVQLESQNKLLKKVLSNNGLDINKELQKVKGHHFSK